MITATITSEMQAKYFRSLPLHWSQEEVETHKGYSIFSYFLTTDYDFKQDVLSFGSEVEILEPDHELVDARLRALSGW